MRLIFRAVKIFSFIAILAALSLIATGLVVTFGTDQTDPIENAARDFLGNRTGRQAIDQGLEAMFDALLYWMVAAIGLHVTAKDNRE